MTDQPTDRPEHGIAEACYSMAAWSGKHEPYMKCTCGFSACEETWEEVGHEMDWHLKMVVPHAD